jgi:hypothetical protein
VEEHTVAGNHQQAERRTVAAGKQQAGQRVVAAEGSNLLAERLERPDIHLPQVQTEHTEDCMQVEHLAADGIEAAAVDIEPEAADIAEAGIAAVVVAVGIVGLDTLLEFQVHRKVECQKKERRFVRAPKAPMTKRFKRSLFGSLEVHLLLDSKRFGEAD